jgi:hypothetical protein
MTKTRLISHPMHYNHVHSDLTVACKKFDAVKIQRYVQLYQSP